MPMVDKSGDPIALWQQMVSEMQKGFNAFAKQTLAPPGERKQNDSALGSPAGAQRQLTDFMESYLVGMNLPSRAQLNSMIERLRAIEHELSEIKALMHRMADSPKAEEPPRQPARPRHKRRSGPERPSAAADKGGT
jgi:hypothetical protein